MNDVKFTIKRNVIIGMLIMVSWVLVILEIFEIAELSKDNQKLLIQVDQTMGNYNKIKTEYEILNSKYEQTLSENERLIDLIRISDRYMEVE